MQNQTRLLFVVNDAEFFLSHRLPIALAAAAAGYQVHVATPRGPGVGEIARQGLRHHPIPLTRSGSRPWQELGSLYALYRLYRRLRPALVHHVAVKPVLYGGIAARLAGVPGVVSAVPGLGYVFSGAGFAWLLRQLVLRLYRLALQAPNARVILQNPDDRETLIAHGAIRPAQAVLIRGSGVDLTRFVPAPEPPGPVQVVLAARMLRAKGIESFVAAAGRLRQAGEPARYALVGESDPGSPTAIPLAQLRRWQEEGVVQWWGRQHDMPGLFARSHIVCLPSEREGLPKVLIEAAACGRPIVATDVPGCREVVQHGRNGLLVPPQDPAALAAALCRLIREPQLRQRMGRCGRARAEAEFGLEHVVAASLAVYSELLAPAPPAAPPQSAAGVPSPPVPPARLRRRAASRRLGNRP